MGIGWGVINGEFESTDVDGSKLSNAAFFDFQSSRVVGIQAKIDSNWGGFVELRSTSAYATADNDPFNQSSGDTLELDFSGSMVSLVGYYRF